MRTVKLTDVSNGREVTLDNTRAQTVLTEIHRVSGSFWLRILWLLFGALLRKRYNGVLNRIAPDMEITINNGSTRVYQVYARSILVDRAGRHMQFYMGLLLQEWLEL